MADELPGAVGRGAARADSDDLLRLLVDSAVDYAIFMLDVYGRVISWNPGAQRLKGYSADEIIGQHFSRFYTPEDIARGMPDRQLAVATAEGRAEDEGWRVRKDGSQFWAGVTIAALRGSDGALRGFGKVTRDLTARKRAEEAALDLLQLERDASNRLRQLDMMKNEFVAMVAHDLGSPLSVVMGFVDVLLADWDELDDTAKHDMLERVRRTAENLAGLVDDVLVVGRIESGELRLEPAPFDLVALLRQAAVESAPPASGRRVLVDTAEVAMAFGDERRVWQVVTNVLSNAHKFSPPGADIDIGLSVQGDEWVVSVSDHGPGIAPEHQETVFARLARLPQAEGSSVRGTGLGLYISRLLVEAHGGRIWVDSDPGHGATFRFTLPSAAEAGS